MMDNAKLNEMVKTAQRIELLRRRIEQENTIFKTYNDKGNSSDTVAWLGSLVDSYRFKERAELILYIITIIRKDQEECEKELEQIASL
jgi:hypothetical protein